jgi:hypothetical protein
MRFGRLELLVLLAISVGFSTECQARMVLISVTDTRGEPVEGATIRGMIRIASEEDIRFEEETDGSGEVILEYPGKKGELFFWAEKDGWYLDKGPLEVPDPVNLGETNKIRIRLVKKTSAQF